MKQIALLSPLSSRCERVRAALLLAAEAWELARDKAPPLPAALILELNAMVQSIAFNNQRNGADDDFIIIYLVSSKISATRIL